MWEKKFAGLVETSLVVTPPTFFFYFTKGVHEVQEPPTKGRTCDISDESTFQEL